MTSPLLSLNQQQWENLCDGCGRCCLVKLQDEDTNQLYYTNLSCEFLDQDTCRCTQYSDRKNKKPECIVLSKQNLDVLEWMPITCAYRRFDRGEAPLNHLGELSVKGKTVNETRVDPDDQEDYIIDWIDFD
ncbi:MAG: hypothetical protein GKR96_03835 [Gammaproteobacteria bacterium]|nr:hypothetical protein [Gammaproteobacteria bacterium]